MSIKITVTKPERVKKNFKGCIYFGIPKSTSSNTKNGKNDRKEFTNADILFILERGSPAKNLPPRPVLSSVIKLHAKELNEALYRSLPVVFGGTDDEIDKYFEALALKIQGWAQMFFVREGQQLWIPSQRVLRAEKKGKKANTLIDTSSLRQSIIAFYSKDGES